MPCPLILTFDSCLADGDILPTTTIDKLVAICFMPLAASSLAASIGRFEKLSESATIHYTNFRLKLGDMLRHRAEATAKPTATPTLTREQFVLQALIDFDLVEQATIEELFKRFDALAAKIEAGSADEEKKLTVRNLFIELVTQGRVVDANDRLHTGHDGLQQGTVAVNMATKDRGFEEWFDKVWVPSLPESLQPESSVTIEMSSRGSCADLTTMTSERRSFVDVTFDIESEPSQGSAEIKNSTSWPTEEATAPPIARTPRSQRASSLLPEPMPLPPPLPPGRRATTSYIRLADTTAEHVVRELDDEPLSPELSLVDNVDSTADDRLWRA